MSDQNQAEIKIVDSLAGGEYANAMQVVHNKDEFLITFFNVASSSGRVCGKIMTSPGHLKRMISALSQNLKKYEKQYGEVKESESPRKEIGF